MKFQLRLYIPLLVGLFQRLESQSAGKTMRMFSLFLIFMVFCLNGTAQTITLVGQKNLGGAFEDRASSIITSTTIKQVGSKKQELGIKHFGAISNVYEDAQ